MFENMKIKQDVSDEKLKASINICRGFVFSSPIAVAGCFVIGEHFFKSFAFGFLLLPIMLLSAMYFYKLLKLYESELKKRNSKTPVT